MNHSFVDIARATLHAAWPKSDASYEVSRLVEEGYEKGESCDIAFSVSLADPSLAGDAAASARVAGYTVDASQAARGFITVQTPIALRTFGLAKVISHLERVVAPHGGFVALIGPTRPPRNGVRIQVDQGREDEPRGVTGRAVA